MYKYKALSPKEVEENRRSFGKNTFSEPKKQSAFGILLEKFKDPIVRILLIALLLSFLVAFYQCFVGDKGGDAFLEPIGILLAILLSTLIGFVFENSANKKFELISKMGEEVMVNVMRQKDESEDSCCAMAVRRDDIVKGDIVLLSTGDEVPADAILLETNSLQLNESSLTGESLVNKTCKEEDFDPEATYPSNMVYRGSCVVNGTGVARVCAVGDASEYGKVYKGSQIETNVETPLSLQLKKLSNLISYVGYSVAILVLVGRLLSFCLTQGVAGLGEGLGGDGGAAGASAASGFLSALFAGELSGMELLTFGKYVLDSFMIAVTVIVVSVPEGLPMSVSLSLALSMKRMLTSNNLVRKMHACETMGACTVICTDKTGTLTQNRMSVYEYVAGGGADAAAGGGDGSGSEATNCGTTATDCGGSNLGSAALDAYAMENIAVNSSANLEFEEDGKLGSSNSDKQAASKLGNRNETKVGSDSEKIKVLGNPTEGALLMLLHDKGEDYNKIRQGCEVLEQLPFSTERKYMASLVLSGFERKNSGSGQVLAEPKERILYMKGAPEIILRFCSNLSGETLEFINSKLLEFQNKAMRTLAIAYKIIEDENFEIGEGLNACNDMIFSGFFAISDPIREDVPKAIENCKNAGIDIKIVTGDTIGTAKEIARQIGMWNEGYGEKNIITGSDFEALSDEEVKERLKDLKIIARARPMDKERLVRSLQTQGEVVAVTGDGTNDAPALNVAQVGLSMGDGTAVAKQASDISILDNSFTSINKAVMWGRSLYKNIQRFIVFQMTINLIACLIVVIGAFLGTESPLTITQMLWVNLIMDTFAAMALASLPPSEDVMNQKPRKQSDFILSRVMSQNIVGVGAIFLAFLFGLMQMFRLEEINSLSNLSLGEFAALYAKNYFCFSSTASVHISMYESAVFFSFFVMLQFWNMFNAKAFMSKGSTFRNFGKSIYGFGSVLLIILLGQVLIVSFGGEMFNVEAISLKDWLCIIVSTSLVLWVGEIKRLLCGGKG